jgi:hypothetical protein
VLAEEFEPGQKKQSENAIALALTLSLIFVPYRRPVAHI